VPDDHSPRRDFWTQHAFLSALPALIVKPG